MSARHMTRALLVACAVSTSATAWADDTELEGLLSETIITTASKSAERGSSAPATSTTLTAEDMRSYGIHSINEAIDFLSLGAMTSNTLRGADVGARGILLPSDQGDHFLLLVNGHATNEALYGAARFDRGAGIPIEVVDHIEVILGPGSVLYGSNAMLGVINVVTKRARDYAGGHAIAEVEPLKSWRVGAGAGLEFKLGNAPSELLLQLDYYKQDGPVFEVGPQRVGNDWITGQPIAYAPGQPTGFWGGKAADSYYSRVPSALLTFRVKDLELMLHASTYKRASPFNHPFAPLDSDFDDPTNYELDRSLSLDVKNRFEISSVVQMNVRLYGDTFDYQRFMNSSTRQNCIYSNVATCRRVTQGESWWGGAEIQSSFDWIKDGSFVTLLGADARQRHVASLSDTYNRDTNQRIDSSSSYLHENDHLLGAYLQQTWQPSRAFTTNAGARLDLDPNFGNRLSPRIASTLQVWRGGTVKAVYSEAFRAPSWQEARWSSAQQVLSEGLRPESVRSVEASLDQTLGNHHLLFGVFRSWWKDLVELHVLNVAEIVAAEAKSQLLVGTDAASQYRNVSSIDNYGFNTGYSGSFLDGRLHYGLNVTGAIAHRKAENGATQALVVAPQFFGNARLAYTIAPSGPTFALAGAFVGQRPADRALNGSFAPAPWAPANLELRATISGPLPFLGKLSYRVSADYNFASAGPYVVGPIQDAVGPATNPTLGRPAAELNPIDRFRTAIGLQYDFGGR